MHCFQKLKKVSVAVNANIEDSKSLSHISTEDQSLDHSDILKKDGVEIDSSENLRSAKLKTGNANKSMKKNSKTKFEEFLLKDVEHAETCAKEDLKLERRLAKKLKVKEGNLRGLDDGLNIFFEGIPSVLDSFGQESEHAEDLKRHERRSLGKQRKRRESEHTSDGAHAIDSMDRACQPPDAPDESHPRSKKKRGMLKVDSKLGLPEPAETSGEEASLQDTPAMASATEATVKYIAPHLRTYVRLESEEHSQLRRRVRGMILFLERFLLQSV